jgi:hypothetical protein
MWLGFRLHHSLVVPADASCAPRYTATRARGDRGPLSVAGGELLIDSREVAAKVIDENVQLTKLVTVCTS